MLSKTVSIPLSRDTIPQAAVAAALARGVGQDYLASGVYLLRGVQRVHLDCSVTVGLGCEARQAYKPDLPALLVHLVELLAPDCMPATVAALITSALHHARVMPTAAATADVVAAALQRYVAAVSETLPRVQRAGAVQVRGTVQPIGWEGVGDNPKKGA